MNSPRIYNFAFRKQSKQKPTSRNDFQNKIQTSTNQIKNETKTIRYYNYSRGIDTTQCHTWKGSHSRRFNDGSLWWSSYSNSWMGNVFRTIPYKRMDFHQLRKRWQRYLWRPKCCLPCLDDVGEGSAEGVDKHPGFVEPSVLTTCSCLLSQQLRLFLRIFSTGNEPDGREKDNNSFHHTNIGIRGWP